MDNRHLFLTRRARHTFGGYAFSQLRNEQNGESLAGLEQDLALRDFTVNAMAVDEKGSLYDPYGGREDLKRKIIRSPLNEPKQRFTEDPLRMMRAIRFCSTFGFSLHQNTYEAIVKQSSLLPRVAPERIREELNRILISNRPSRGIRLLLETGLLQHVMPEAMSMVGL